MSRHRTKHMANHPGHLWRAACAALAGGLVLIHGAVSAQAAGESERPRAPRELYNDGTVKLRQGKLTEAEIALQDAIASQDPRVQPAALYNLGIARFQDGEHERTNAPDSDKVQKAAAQTQRAGSEAIRAVDAALASDDVQAMVNAYLLGRGARKDLKAATEAVKSAMETDGSVLTKWRRASGDFKSVSELNPADKDAPANADLVDRHIAQLVDKMRPLAASRDGLTQTGEELKQKMMKLKGKIPQNIGEQMPGDDGEEDGGDHSPKQFKGNEQEGPVKSGHQMQLTREEAKQFLNMLRLDADRKLSLGGDQKTPPTDRRGKDW